MAADSANWRTMLYQPPVEWRRPVSDPGEYVPGRAAQFLAAVRGAQFMAGQRAQFRERWIAARVVDDSKRRRVTAATDGGAKAAVDSSAEAESRVEESLDGGEDYDMDDAESGSGGRQCLLADDDRSTARGVATASVRIQCSGRSEHCM